MKKTLALIFFIALLFSQSAFAKAEDQKNDSKETESSTESSDDLYKLFDIDIFSLSKKNEEAFDAASSIYVLSSEDIRRSGATSIPEALRLVPGLQVAKIDGHKWAISARGFNSQFSNKLLVMIDGRTVYTPLFSGVVWDIQDYVLDDVEKIEVIRGSGGAIWGANAVNGIINIITKNSVDSQGGYVSGTVGNQGQVIAEARYGGATESLNHYRLYAKQVNHGEMDRLHSNVGNNDGYRQSQAGFRYDIRSIEENTITIHGDVRDGKADNYFNFQNFGTSAGRAANKDSKGANLVANWDKTLSKKSSFTLQTYLDYDQFDMVVLRRDGRTADVDFQYFYDLNRQNQLAFGLGYRLISDKITERPLLNNAVPLDYTPNQRTNQIFSTFLQDKISLIADTFYLTLGSKFEHNDYTGVEFQPSAKFTLYPARNQTAWASVSRAVRTPTRGEDSIRINNPSDGGNLQAGNADYESENVVAYELGYRIKPSRTSLVDVAIFYNDYSNLRTFNPKDGFTANTTNFGTGESYGAEITIKWQAIENWRLEAGYDFLQIDVQNKNIATESPAFPIYYAEGQSPKNQFRLRSNYNITPKIEFDNVFYYVDSLPLSHGASASDQSGVPSYTSFDTRLGYAFNSKLDLSAGIKNLFDKRHQEFDKGLFSNETDVGRTFYLKAELRF